MKSRGILFLLVYLFGATLAAQTTNRAAVSVNGTDMATCTVPDPCRTFAVALSKTNSGGEVIALTSGGYGPFLIDRPVSIIVAPGVFAGLIAGNPGQNAIDVHAGAGAKVIIRGLTINGLGMAQAGIAINGSAAETHVENCIIDGFATWGVLASLNSTITDTTIRRCGEGIRIDNTVAPVRATIERVSIMDSTTESILAWRNSVVVAREVSAIGTQHALHALEGGQLSLENCLVTRASSRGIYADGTGSVVRISNCLSTGNAFGVSIEGGAVMETWSNNKVRGNTFNINGTLTPVSQN